MLNCCVASTVDTREADVISTIPLEQERAAGQKEEDDPTPGEEEPSHHVPAVEEPEQLHHSKVEEDIPSFTCVIERDAPGPWGLQVHPMHPYLQVSNVKAEGPFAKYNSESQMKICQDDMIISVNGREAPKQMLSIIKDEECNKLELVCSRTKRLDLEVRREPGQSWGIIVEHQADLNGLLVKKIDEDSVASSVNAYAEPGEMLLAMDLVLSINGQVGNPGKMKSAMKESDVIKLIALRVSRPLRQP